MSQDWHLEESLPLRGLHVLAPWTWLALVLVVVLLAIYVALGRLLVAQLPALREPILASLNERLPFEVEARELSGQWVGFSPELRLSGVLLSSGDGETAPLALSGGRLRIDVPESLRSRSLQLSRLEVRGLSLQAELTDEGTIELQGFRTGGGDALRNWLETFLPNVERVRLSDSRLMLSTAQETFDLTLALSLEREGSARHLQGRLDGAAISLAIDAAGVGNPLSPASWRGDVYTDLRSPDLAALGSLWDGLQLPFTVAGETSTQFWLNRADGDSKASVRLSSRNLRLQERGGAWSLPMDELSFEAALSQRARHWSLMTEDFHVERAGEIVDLDRAQFDWWGQSLRVRLKDLELDDLPALLGAAPGIPAGVREVLPELAPRGHLDSIELRLDDLTRPAQTWRLRADLATVALDSWRGAPAMTGVSGFLALGPKGGRLQLDSQDLSMHFPKVYRDALTFEDAAGELRLSWDRDALYLDSGLLKVSGEEGDGSGLLALHIPLKPTDIGIELELLIGLEDSAADYRNRYLPYKLPASLLAWLEDSVRAADVPVGGFVWRGSTKRGQNAHRTMQLFLRAENGELAFDPAWPALTDLSGTVWVDDGRSFALIDRARSLDAEVQDLVLRVIASAGQARLDVAAGVSGDAAAASALLADSPLAALTAGVFADWDFGGPVSGDLALSLALGVPGASPWVDLSLALDDVNARIAQVDLPLDGINGQLNYSSETGFTGSRVQATLLGGGVDVLARSTPRRGGFDLALDATVDAAAVAEWLDLDVLNFASGVADLSGSLRLDDDRGAHLSLASDLQNVSLDAPAPFGKTDGPLLPLSLDLPLVSSPRLSLSLGERLRMAFDFNEAGLQRTAVMLGGEAPPTDDCDVRYCLAGQLSTLDLSGWKDFQRRYLPDGAVPDTLPEATPDALDGGAGSEAGAPQAFSYSVSSLEVGDLSLGARRFGPARIDLSGVDQSWGGEISSGWLTASLTRPGGALQLAIQDLDIRDFGAGEPADVRDLANALPPMRVTVDRLRSGDRELGSLAFDLQPRPAQNALYAADLSGTLWGAQLADPYAGMLCWAMGENGEETTLEIDASFADLGAVVAAAGFDPSLESEAGRARLRLAWPGAPADFDIAETRGMLRLDAERGRVLESRPGPLALIGFLNFAEILRGLSLSHMFESGVPFETADAEMYLHGGTVEIADLQIDGAASSFAFSGVSDLERGEVNGELVVTLPVANNLPWVAALAGGIPVAAGVFVVSKVFEKQVNRMSSAVYQISGDIEAPEVEFRRIFDDTLTPTAAAREGSGTGGD
ncbi:MAG: AsmA-like C-terminal region-containing protein [Pseudomonadota bacterium]